MQRTGNSQNRLVGDSQLLCCRRMSLHDFVAAVVHLKSERAEKIEFFRVEPEKKEKEMSTSFRCPDTVKCRPYQFVYETRKKN